MLANYTHSPLAPDDILSASITSAGVTAGLATTQGHFYYLKDSLGSITEIMNTSGSVVQKYDYSSFGKLLSIKDGGGADISASPVLKTSFTFTGREWDEEASLYYYRARTYDPQIGRFLQKDPDPGKRKEPITFVSPYVYAVNSPINHSDPSGLQYNVGGDNDGSDVHGYYCGFSARGQRKDPFISRPGPGNSSNPPEDRLDNQCRAHDDAYSDENWASLDIIKSRERMDTDAGLFAEGIRYSFTKPGEGLPVAIFGSVLFTVYSLPMYLTSIPFAFINTIFNLNWHL